MITALNIKGAARFEATLADAAKQVASLDDANAEAGRIVASLAALTAPRLTGQLAGSITPEVAGAGQVGVEVGSDLIYAPPIHNGWAAHGIEARPFLSDALERQAPGVLVAYSRGVEAALAGVEGA